VAAKFYVYSDVSHTHPLPEAGWFACNEVKMKMKKGNEDEMKVKMS